MKIEDNDDNFIALAAFRYVLGRMTYAPGLVRDWLDKHWAQLHQQTRAQILKELEHEILVHEQEVKANPRQSKHNLGLESDYWDWKAFCERHARG